MTEEQKTPEDQKPRITLDPSKFTINEEGQVIIVDPEFADALRTAANEDTDNNMGHGILVGVIVGP